VAKKPYPQKLWISLWRTLPEIAESLTSQGLSYSCATIDQKKTVLKQQDKNLHLFASAP
jgi:hypothetical protein